jgi:hypothetical protein
VDYAAEERDTINEEWLPCAVCNEPTCAEHGRDYPGGWEHEMCHESPLYSRYDYTEA